MIEESKVEKAVAYGLSKIQPSSGLLDRINHQAETLELPEAPVSLSLWSRLRLGPRLELAAACILLVCLVGVAAYRSSNSTRAGIGGETGSGTPTPAHRIYSGDADDGTVRLQATLDHQESGDWNVVTTIQNLSGGAIELQYECDNLLRLDGALIKRDCQAKPGILLEAGQTKQEELVLPGRYQGTPTTGWLAYRIRSEGKQNPARTVKVSFQEGVRNCCPEPNWRASDVVAKFKAANINATLTGDVSPLFFGAKQVQTISAEGENVVVYVFENAADAQWALKTMQDPQANTVGWAGTPRFFPMGNLVVQIDFGHEQAAQKLKDALFGGSSQSSLPIDGADDLGWNSIQATFTIPSFPAKITPEQARSIAAEHIGNPPDNAQVWVGYVLLTLPDSPVINGKKMAAYPVYLVTYDGVKVIPTGPGPLPATGAPARAAAPPAGTVGASGKVTAILDANNGDWIMAIAR